MMSNARQKRLLLGLGAACLLFVFFYLLNRRSAEAVPTGDGRGFYYTGPRESKNHPGVWVDAAGNRVPPPPEYANSKLPAGGSHP